MPTVDYRVFNDLFAMQSEDQEGLSKAAAASLPVLRTHVREGCLMNQVWAMETAPEARIQRSLADPTQRYVYDDIEPDFVAMAQNADGMPESRFYAAEACATYFYPIRSKEVVTTTERIRALPYSVEEYFKRFIGNEVARQRDVIWVAGMDAAVAASGQVINIASSGPLYKDLVSAADLIDGNIYSEIFCTDIIMHYSFLNKLKKGGVPEFDSGAWEIFADGYKRTTIDGRRLHLTRKKEFDKDTAYFVTEKKYVATNYEDYPLKFQAKIDMDDIKLEAKASVGSLIYNIYGVSKLVWTTT